MGIKRNLSFTYIMPLVLADVPIHKKGIVNTFLYHKDHPKLNKGIVTGIFVLLTYEFVGKQDLKHNPNCHLIEDVDEDHFLAFITTEDEKMWADINQAVIGKYSQMSLRGKKVIKYYLNLKGNSPIIGVLNRAPALRKEMEEALNVKIPTDHELGNIMEKERETFEHKLIKTNKL